MFVRSHLLISTNFSTLQIDILLIRSLREILFFSKNVTWRAPLLNASKPNEPVPANKSSTRMLSKDRFVFPFSSKLNMFSLTRSDVGLR